MQWLCLYYDIVVIHVLCKTCMCNAIQRRFRIIIITIYYQSRQRRRLIINARHRRADDIANSRLRETTSTSTSGRASYQPTAKRKRPVLPQRSNVTKRSTTVHSAELDAHYGVLSRTAMFHFYWNNFNILFNNIYDTQRRVCLTYFFIFCPHIAALPSRLSLSPARHPPRHRAPSVYNIIIRDAAPYHRHRWQATFKSFFLLYQIQLVTRKKI